MKPGTVNVPIHYLYTESTITYLDEFACDPVTEVKLAVPKNIVGNSKWITMVLLYPTSVISTG